MAPEAFYGSSEYSPEAEELFARYVREVDAGTAPDFDAFCAEHEAQMDELYGLHADWDNVRGLLAKLGRVPASGEQAHAHEPAATDPPNTPATRTRSVWIGVAVIALAVASGLGGWAWTLFQAREVLAREQRAGLAREEAAHIELGAAREEGRALARRGSELERELATTTEAVATLEGHNEALTTERDTERALAEQARLAAERSAAEAARLAALVTVEDLIARENELWPTAREVRPALEAWLTEADALAARIAALAPAAPEPGLEPAHLSRARERLAAFGADGSEGGLLVFTRERLARLTDWEAARADDNERWDAVLDALPADSPVPACGFVPLRTHPATELWLLADGQTGEVPVRDDGGNWTAGDECALLFTLVPGGDVDGHTEPAFLLALEAPSDAHVQRALGPHAELGVAQHADNWTRMGYRSLTSVQTELALQSGLELANDTARPVCSLTAAATRPVPGK